ncbi:metallophosphoesterase [Candidatus Omnitrophota bacterium]
MKIAVTSDIHYDLIRSSEDRLQFERFLEALYSEKPDVLIIAGDVIGLGWQMLPECLSIFASVCPERLMVFGNHDYWSRDKKTFQHLEFISDLIEDNGFHLLDNHSRIIGSTGFAGNCGWYDYSLAHNHNSGMFSFEKKMINGRVIWNDANYINLEKSDSEHARNLFNRLEHDIVALENRVETIVAVTHHLAFGDMVIRKDDDPLWNFCNAFIGSRKIGEMLLRHPRVTHHLCGHTHSTSDIMIGQLRSLNPGSTYRVKKYLCFEIP